MKSSKKKKDSHISRSAAIELNTFCGAFYHHMTDIGWMAGSSSSQCL